MRINPNSSIRSGYAFEDLFVVKLLFDWLKSPETYKAIRVQYIPDEINNNKFYLDDVIAIDKINSYHLYQLKYRQNPDTDYWSFSNLLERGNKKEAMLGKWIRSIDLITSKCKGYFLTNGLPDREIQACLINDKIDYNKIKQRYPLHNEALLKMGFNESQLRKFFEIFSFQFGNPNKNEFEASLRASFYNDLKVTKAGFDNLLLSISKEGSEKHPKEFTVANTRKLLEWYNPRPLKQDFEIPLDFELYDHQKHERLIEELHDSKGGIKVIIGKPGVGKSTYLSNLHNTLIDHIGTLSIRHHYHLNPKDNSYYDRLDAKRAAEALKAEFKKLPDHILGDFANQNLRHTSLKDIITCIAQYHYKLGKTFVIIIDGLDHVIRERKSKDELINFLDEILYPQDGLWIVLGTQELATEYFRNIIHNKAPKNTWIEIRGLKKDSVKELILKNAAGLILPKHQHGITELVEAVYEKTQGNALHLRYVVSQLRTKSDVASSASLRFILPYKDEIENYYADLWRQIPAISKTFVLAISLFDCKMNEIDITELGSYLTTVPSKITEGFNHIQHLLRVDISGVAIYHNSFLVFINNQVEREQQRKLLYLRSRKWLKGTTNNYIKWLLLPQVEYQLGNPKPLLSIDRNWVIDSYICCRNEIQIINLLELAVEAAFKKNDFSKVILFRIFISSVSERNANLGDVISKIWQLSFEINAKNELLYPDIDTLEGYQIKEYLITLNKRGVLPNIPDEIYDRFNELLSDNNGYDADESVPYWIELMAHFHKEKTAAQVYKFISQFQHNHKSGKYYSIYIKFLLKAGIIEKVKEILQFQFSEQEKEEIAEVLISYDLENETGYGYDFISSLIDDTRNYAIVFYFLLKEGRIPEIISLPTDSDFPYELDLHNPQSFDVLDLYLNSFVKGVILCLRKEEHTIVNWIISQNDRWPITVMKKLFETSRLIAHSIQTRQRIDYRSIIDIFEPIRMLDFREDDKIFEIRRFVIPRCIIYIMKLSILINKKNCLQYSYTDRDIIKFKSCKWFYTNTIVSHLFTFNYPPLTEAGLHALINSGISNIEQDIEPFKDKAETLVDLAVIAHRCNNISVAKNLLLRSSQNLISYGYHKDTYLYAVLQGIDICAQAGSTKTLEYIKRVAPYIHTVGDFTDGDETKSFIHNLADLYGKYNPQWLYKLYFKSVNEQDYYKADSFFGDIVSMLPLPEPANAAVLSTSLDDNSYNTLYYRSKTDKEAQKALKGIQNIFGEIDYSSKSTNSNQSYKPKKSRTPDYSKVTPVRLKKILEDIIPTDFERKEFMQANYLLAWLAYWTGRPDKSEMDIYYNVREIIEPHIEHASAEVLNLLYPIALSYDRDFAFECLVRAHANSYIWGATWAKRLEDSKIMWGITITDFPERLDEYFEKTLLYTGENYGKGGQYFIPIPKSIAFFCDCHNLLLAENILESAISHLAELIPGTKIPSLAYINDKDQIDAFDILLLRLTWVNPIVRERAATGLSNLLRDDTAGTFHLKLIKWLSVQKLESILSYGLIVILKSLEYSNSKSYRHIQPNDLLDVIVGRTTTLYALLNIISLKRTGTQFLDSSFNTKETIDITEVSELDKFKRSIGHHIQLGFIDMCEKLEDKTGFKAFNLWALIFERKKKEIDLKEGHYLDNYCNSKREYMMGRATIVSELLKSSLMKVLDYLFHEGYINGGDLFFHTFNLIPIDFSIWKIKLSAKPDWWPKFKVIPEEGENVVMSLDLIQPIKNILNPVGGWRLFHLDGAIIPSGDFYENVLKGAIKVIPFAYKLIGTNIPGKEVIYDSVESLGKYFPAGHYLNNFNLFDNEMSFSPDSSFPVVEGDLMMFPLVADIHSLAGNIWQYYRLHGAFKLLAPPLHAGLTKQIKGGKLQFIDCNNDVVCKVEDFLFGLRDKVPYKSDVPYGSYILMKDSFLESVLSKQGLRLAYVCKINYKTKKYSHSDETTEATFYELINFSPIII